MSTFKKAGLRLGLVAALLLALAPAHAAMIGTDAVLDHANRGQLVEMLGREDVRRQMIEMGVDPEAASARVRQMTDEEVAQLAGRLDELPAGSGIGTVELLLIIIIIILLI